MRDEWYDATDWRSFVEKVIEGRELTRRELAKRVDLSESLVSMMLSGRRPMDPARVEVFAEVLGLDAEGAIGLGQVAGDRAKLGQQHGHRADLEDDRLPQVDVGNTSKDAS